MTLRQHFLSSGNWLFRWRSYLPLPLFGVVLLGIYGFRYPLGSHLLDVVWDLFCFGIGLLGLLIRILTIAHTPRGTSGRNQCEQRADVLNTTGMYSLLRHPLYLGNYFMWLSVAMLPRTWWVPLVGSLVFCL